MCISVHNKQVISKNWATRPTFHMSYGLDINSIIGQDDQLLALKSNTSGV